MKLIELLEVESIINKRGIYFLMDNDEEVVYVGSSENVGARIYAHQSQFEKAFSKYASISLPKLSESDLLQFEANFIAKYRPKYNKGMPPSSWKMIRGTLKNQREITKTHIRFCELNGVLYYDGKSKI